MNRRLKNVGPNLPTALRRRLSWAPLDLVNFLGACQAIHSGMDHPAAATVGGLQIHYFGPENSFVGR